MHSTYQQHTVDGQNPAPIDKQAIPLFTGFYTSQVVQDFVHQQYLPKGLVAATTGRALSVVETRRPAVRPLPWRQAQSLLAGSWIIPCFLGKSETGALGWLDYIEDYTTPGWVVSNIFYVHPENWGRWFPFWRAYFFKWVGSTTK